MKNSIYLKLLFVFGLHLASFTFLRSQAPPPPPPPPVNKSSHISNVEKFEVFTEKGKSGLRSVNSQRIIVAASMDRIEVVRKSSIVFSPGVSLYDNVYIVTREGKSGVVNKVGEYLLPLEYDYINEDYVAKNGQYGIVNMSKKVIVPLKYDKIKSLCFGRLGFLEDDKWGLMQSNGRILIPAVLAEIKHGFSGDHLYLIANNNKVGLYNCSEDKIPFQPKFDTIYKIESRLKPGNSRFNVQPKESNPYFIAVKDANKGVIDLKGNIIVDMLYEEINEVAEAEGLVGYIIKQNDKFGMLSPEGIEVFPAEHSEIVYLNQLMFSLTKNKKCALANSEGIELTSFKYDKIGYFPYLLEMPPEAKTTKIELNGKYGIINSTGELKEKIDKEIILNGYGDVEVLFSEFVAALKSDDDEVIREFADMIAIDTQTVLMMMRLDLNYRGVPNDIFKRKMLITDFTVDYFSRMIKYRDRLKNDGELASLKNLGPQNLGYGVFSKRYDIPATEVSFTMKSDKRSHDVKLGELIRINGVWKVFTYPRFN